MPRPRSSLPLIYSCSGASSAAQLANHVAVALDRAGQAQMSCIAGVGGDVASLVRVATSGRPIVVVDGCALHCAKRCLDRHGVQPTVHWTLSELGVEKRLGEDYDPEQAAQVTEQVAAALPPRATRCAPPG